MNKKIDISVCVPTYKRPLMVKEAIQSFTAQDYKNSEIVVSDDGTDLATEQIVREMMTKDDRIKYIKNEKNIGFCKNLLKSMEISSGKYIFLLGDDDLIVGESTLSHYVDIFNKYKNVSFIYSNMLQFNSNYEMDYAYRFFPENRFFKSGEDAISNIWLKSTFIAGLGLRKIPDMFELYPKGDVLFPQVEMIGKMLQEYDAYGLARYSSAARAHSDQLGFHMMKKKRIVGNERHASIELYEISDNMRKYITSQKVENKIEPRFIEATVQKFLQAADKSVVIAEGIKTNKKTFLQNVVNSIKKEKRIKHDPIFWVMIAIYTVVPNIFIFKIKQIYRNFLRRKVWDKEVKFFEREKVRIGIQ